MQHDRLLRHLVLAALVVSSLSPCTAHAGVQQWVVYDGRSTLQFDSASLEEIGVAVSSTDAVEILTRNTLLAFRMDTESSPAIVFLGDNPLDLESIYLPHRGRLSFDAGGELVELDEWVLRWDGAESGGGLVIAPVNARTDDCFLELRDAKVAFDMHSRMLLIESGALVVSQTLADALGRPDITGASIGMITTDVMMVLANGDRPLEERMDFPVDSSEAIAGTVGPDVIVGNLYQITSWGSVGSIAAFSMGTISCNQGDTPLSWVSSTNQHPVIAQNMFRLKNGRFEHIGQSWLKHGFLALTGNACGLGCNNPGTGSLLGVGCSDPYSASLNGSQGNLGPKYEVNANTGAFSYPPDDPSYAQTIGRRLQVHHSDLDTSIDGGGQYFIESQYVTPDDAASGNQNNNASYRPITIAVNGSSFSASLTGSTKRRQAGVRAWKDTDSSVRETNLQISGDGLMILGSKATDLGTGLWHYEYALHNLNSDRSAGSFAVPIPIGATVLNVGFHDVDYHSGEPFAGTDWSASSGGGSVIWSATAYGTNPNANALRWGTLYNFRFDSDSTPGDVTITIGLFKPGSPSSVTATAIGPAGPPPVCGDDIVEGAEECDPPDTVHCDSECQWICGDAVVQSGEDCDPPDSVSCDALCQWICGDGIAQPGEDCDDAGESATCNADCTVSVCGDGKHNPTAGETCDTGGESASCDANCTSVICGDGMTNESAGEQCDPPNGTTCNNNCRRIATCGDGVLDPNEDCDPPGTASCDNSCQWISRVNDACADAIVICPGTHTGSTLGADSDGSAACGSTSGSSDVWYRYRPGSDGSTTFATCGSIYDSVLSIHTGDCPGTIDTELGCNDDGCGLQSTLTLDVSSGVTYLIRVSGFLGRSGPYTLAVTGPECECNADVDCPEPMDPCTDPACDQTACVTTNTTSACNDENACTTEDTCVDGACVGGPLLACENPPACTDCNENGVRDDCERLPDCNANGLPDECEFADCNDNGINDVCEIADRTLLDCDGGSVGIVDDGASLFGMKCFACHGPDGSGGAGPNIRNHARVELWHMLRPPTTHSGGAHPEYTDKDFADLEAFLADAGSGGRPDSVPDECQTLSDCDSDGVSDGCELRAGTQVDADYDGIPDRCECIAVLPPQPDPISIDKNRFFSIVPGNSGRLTALRVTLASLHHPNPPNAPCCPSPDFSGYEGEVRWIGPPIQFEESLDPLSYFMGSALRCEPYFADWGNIELLHVYGSEIVPSSAYNIQAIDSSCVSYMDDETAYSGTLNAATARWGDIIEPYATVSGPSQPDFIDIAAIVEKFANGEDAPIKVMAELVGNLVNPAALIDFQDIAAVVDAFQAQAYPYSGPEDCP